jgi:hypothetical protein
MKWKASVFALLSAIGCGACGSSSSGGSSGTGTLATFKTGPRPADQAHALASLNASCGTLTVPENRSNPNEGKVQLPVAIIPSQKQPADPDPVVYMAGGPGANAIAPAGILVSVGLNQNRDLIIMNQRGVAYTEPNLACPEIDRFKRPSACVTILLIPASCTWPRRKPAMIAWLAKGST